MIRCFAEHELLNGDRENLIAMAHWNTAHFFRVPGDHMRAAREGAIKAIDRLRKMPIGCRFVRANWLMEFETASKQWGLKPDGEKDYSPEPDWRNVQLYGLETSKPREQVCIFGQELRKAKIALDYFYIDHENELPGTHFNRRRQFHIRAQAMRKIAINDAPLRVKESLFRPPRVPMVFNWNFCKPARQIPAFGWWGEVVDATIDGSSCPEAYMTKSSRYAGRDGHWMWHAFVDLMNTVRSCIVGSGRPATVIPWLSGPVSKEEIPPSPGSFFGHDPREYAAAMFLTERFIMHAAMMGVRTFGLANYMLPKPWRADAELRISGAMEMAELLVKGQRPGTENAIRMAMTLDPTPGVVRTGRFVTSAEQLVKVLKGGVEGGSESRHT